LAQQVIVVGLDGSEGSVRAAQWASQYARRVDARVIAVHVLSYSKEFVRDLPPTGMTNWRVRLCERLDQWAAPVRNARVDVRCILREADSVDGGLVDVADAEDVDLIVLGAHGHGDLADRLLGAVTYKVSHKARHPVVIVPVDWAPTQMADDTALVDVP
jgi:nucleotide-binding universal stress UspA family protein